MTKRAVLGDRRVFPHEGPALFGMAFVAVLIDRGAAQHGLVGRSMGFVTARARHFPMPDRMRKCPVDFGALLRMALQTGL